MRALSIGNTWSSLRLSIHVAVNNNSGAYDAAAALRIGMCSGQAQPFSSPTCKNYVGIALDTGWTFAANSGNPYYNLGNWISWATKINGVLATSTINNSGINYIPCAASGSTFRRVILAVLITKGSPSYTLNDLAPSSSFINTDLTTAQFLDFVDQTNAAPTIAGVTWTAPSVGVTMSEAAGPLDTLSIMWNRSVYPLHLYGIGVTRLS